MKKPNPMENTQPRKSAGARSLTLRELDITILRLVYEHRFMDMELLSAFLTDEADATHTTEGADGKRRPAKYGFGEKALYKRLRQLAQAKYLEAHQAMAHPMGRGFGGARTAYGLGRSSATVIAEAAAISVKEIRDIIESNQVKARFIEHALKVARFRVLLELACRGSEGRVRLMFWEQGIGLQDWIEGEDWDGENRRFSVYPDAFFGIEVEGKGMAHYFLEMDNATMPIVRSGDGSDIRKKVFGYFYYRLSKQYRRRYHHRVIPDGTVVGLDIFGGRQTADYKEAEGDGIKYFRVLFVAPGLESGKLTENGRIANIIGAFPSFGRQFATSTLYWFASLENFDLKQPESVFSSAWLTANPAHDWKSIVE